MNVHSISFPYHYLEWTGNIHHETQHLPKGARDDATVLDEATWVGKSRGVIEFNWHSNDRILSGIEK